MQTIWSASVLFALTLLSDIQVIQNVCFHEDKTCQMSNVVLNCLHAFIQFSLI